MIGLVEGSFVVDCAGIEFVFQPFPTTPVARLSI